MTDYQTDCRYFSGYKPCEKNPACSEKCPHKAIASPRILIIHLEALGAVLRATSLLAPIKKEWPQCHVTWITSPAARPLLENNPLVDRIFANNHDGTLALSTLSFDYTFCIDKSLVASALINVPQHAGETRGFGVEPRTGAIVPLNSEARRLWELGLSNHEKFSVNKKAETQLLTEALGLDWARDEYVFEFSQSEKVLKEQERGRLGLTSLKFSKVIGINTGCSGMLPHKKLTPDGWVELIHKLYRQDRRARFLLLGGPEDTQRNNEIAAKLSVPGDRVQKTPTENGLRSGFIYVDLCDTVVTGDSLGMHMAIALKKYVVCWFGPSCLHEIDFYGRGEGVKTEAPCSPCWKRECQKPVMCYDLVDLEKIVRACNRIKTPISVPHILNQTIQLPIG